MSASRRQLTAFALLGLVMVLWAGNSIVGRAVRFDVPPLTLAFVRWFGASLLLSPFALSHVRRDWAAIPAMVMVLDRLFFSVRSAGLQKLGVACSIFGVAVVVFEGDLARALGLRFGAGDLLILISVLVWAFYTVLLRLRPAVSPSSFVATTFFIGVLAMAPFAAHDWITGDHIRWSPKVLGAFAYVCVLPSIVSYFIFNSATSTLGPARAGQTITLMPIFGAFLSAALLGEPLHTYHFAGMVLILLGIGLSILTLRGQANAGAPKAAPLEDRA